MILATSNYSRQLFNKPIFPSQEGDAQITEKTQCNVVARSKFHMTTSRKQRFKDRSLQLLDIVPRFEAVPTSNHFRSALGVIERLEQEGSRYWNEDSRQLKRWREYCRVLWKFIKLELGTRRHVQKQDLETVLREFFAEFEHAAHGMHEMLHGTNENPDGDIELRNLYSWFELTFRLATYAIVSFWIDEKSDETSINIDMQFKMDDPPEIHTRETHSYDPMAKPTQKIHRRGMKDL